MDVRHTIDCPVSFLLPKELSSQRGTETHVPFTIVIAERRLDYLFRSERGVFG